MPKTEKQEVAELMLKRAKNDPEFKKELIEELTKRVETCSRLLKILRRK